MDEAFDEKIALRWAFVLNVALTGYEAAAVPDDENYVVTVYDDVELPEGMAQAAGAVLNNVREARAFLLEMLTLQAQHA